MQEKDPASFGLQTLRFLPGSRSGQCFGKGVEEERKNKKEAEIKIIADANLRITLIYE